MSIGDYLQLAFPFSFEYLDAFQQTGVGETAQLARNSKASSGQGGCEVRTACISEG